MCIRDRCGLWLEAFGEGEESAKFVFEGFSGYQHIYVLEEERAVVCMACAVPCSLQGKEGIYLYGVATKKSHRGKGLMSALLELSLIHIYLEFHLFGVIIVSHRLLYFPYRNPSAYSAAPRSIRHGKRVLVIL